MPGFLNVLLLSVIMAAGSLAAGFLPLTLRLHASSTAIKALGVYGVGLLVGAGLGIVIPEGISAVYASASPSSHTNALAARALSFAPIWNLEGRADHDHDHAHSHASDPHKAIGLSLLLGFTLMFLLDSLLSPHSHAHQPLPSLPPSERELQPEPTVQDSERKALSKTVGLVIHSLADGIALGAASAGAGAEAGGLQLVVFLAIAIHKAPAAFGLTSLLISLSPPLASFRLRLSLLSFSLAAPLGALATYVLLTLLGTKLSSVTGYALLLSGGTFLYVAVQGVGETEEVGREVISRGRRAGLVCAGIATPLALALVVEDHH